MTRVFIMLFRLTLRLHVSLAVNDTCVYYVIQANAEASRISGCE